MAKTKNIAEFGDFQTPLALARRACSLLKHSMPAPGSIVEPTCGKGSFLSAAAESFPKCRSFLGREINPAYVEEARRTVNGVALMDIRQGDFFSTRWDTVFAKLEAPILVIGNPPWVTNSELGSLQSANLPKKQNLHGETGLDAMTGKSNFDISEWMLIRLLESLNAKQATVAMLCKTAVARKVLFYAWKKHLNLDRSACYRIDAVEHFGASVEACLFVCSIDPHSARSTECEYYESLEPNSRSRKFGYWDGHLLSDVESYRKLQFLESSETVYRWRSGVKHDCGKVMELTAENGSLKNGFGETVDLENDLLYPILKSSDLANGRIAIPRRRVIVTQRQIGEDTTRLEQTVPLTWSYLVEHADRLDNRRSSIYRKRPRFSIFGIGDYSFSPWKVAISGLYKKLKFSIIGSVDRKPVMVDDTSYFIPCASEREALLLLELLESEEANRFLGSLIFWDAKRPITVSVLQKLDLLALAEFKGIDLSEHVKQNPYCSVKRRQKELTFH